VPSERAGGKIRSPPFSGESRAIWGEIWVDELNAEALLKPLGMGTLGKEQKTFISVLLRKE
jgi:hypothetical protein